MTTAADMTIKKADGSTDIVWTLMQPASGDGSAAIWRSSTVGSSPGTRPELRVISKASQGNVRHVNGTMTYPSYVTDVNGVQKVQGVIFFNFHFSLPPEALDSDILQAVAQATNLLDHSQMVSACTSGFAPT